MYVGVSRILTPIDILRFDNDLDCRGYFHIVSGDDGARGCDSSSSVLLPIDNELPPSSDSLSSLILSLL